ncbi:hypothetical protein DXG01_014832, partial [Tephrocybe rancida]
MSIADVTSSPKSFITKGCLPKDWDMTGSPPKSSTKKVHRDAQNMDKAMLLDLLEHWRLREKEHGCAKALEFTHYMHGKECMPAVGVAKSCHSHGSSPQKKPTKATFNIDSLLPFDKEGDDADMNKATSGDNTDTNERHGEDATHTQAQASKEAIAGNAAAASRNKGNAEQTHGDDRPCRH